MTRHLPGAESINPWTDEDVERHWDSCADVYVSANESVGDAHRQRFVRSVEWLQPEAGQRILNISSRDCAAQDHIAAVCPEAEVIHAEISQGLIDVATELRPEARQLKLENYSRLPFDSSSFQRILTLETLEHVESPVSFLRELRRVAAGGARMVLSCPPASSELPYRVYTRLFGGHGEGPHRFLGSAEVKKLLATAGWKLLNHEGTLLLPVGPRLMRTFAEGIIARFQGTLISELGIRQFYVCE